MREASQEGGLATTPVLVGRLEPIPTLGWVGGDRLFGIDDEEQFPLCEYIHTGARGEILWGLCTAMEHDDQGQGLPAIATGDVELVGAGAGVVSIGSLDELSPCPNIAACLLRQGNRYWPARSTPRQAQRSAAEASSPSWLRRCRLAPFAPTPLLEGRRCPARLILLRVCSGVSRL